MLFDLRPNYGGGNQDNGNILQNVPMQALLHSVPPTLQQATSNPRLHQRLLNTHRQVWVNLLWGHCSFLLGHGPYKVFLSPPKDCFPKVSAIDHVYGSHRVGHD